MRTLALAVSALALAIPASAEVTLNGADEGTYSLEKNHAFLTWSVKHIGISDYTVNFTDFDATLDFNPENPTASTISVTINPLAIETHYPDAEKKIEWHDKLTKGENYFNAEAFPAITFTSTSADLTSDFAGTVTGDLTFLGVTKPVTLDVTYNGTTNVPWFGQRDLLGFNASTTIDRTEWGLTANGGSVSSDVTIEFSGEFLQDE
ncbi:YceI family protein [Hyphomonas sp. FCG-A18]|uniref:YceI family protein n=1 Tax=Hyphomonas sp. FCG-A18 TaxID=3080019 RepID=UPI002B2FC580|nr:YceI family protein [Hyphomonas sp. FCG-A18]